MANPLSPMTDGQLNIRSPMTARRGDNAEAIDSFATPSKQQPRQYQQEQSEIIEWDDDVSSSPFLTEAADSRAASRDWRQATGIDVEVDAIFEDSEIPDMEPPRHNNFDTDYDKENMQASHASPSPKKMFSPLKAQRSSRPNSKGSDTSSALSSAPSSRPVSRDEADSIAMPPPPPSAQKTPRPSSPRKTASLAAETPLPKSRDGSFEKVYDESEAQIDDTSAPTADETSIAVDETNIDDTCFSTFSAIPEMTLFAKLGESSRKSPRKQEHATPDDQMTPRPSRKRPSPSRSPSPTPRRLKTPATDKTSNSFLIDFTQQIERFTNASHQPRGQRSPTKSNTEPNLLSYLNNQRTPAKSNHRMSTPAKSTSLLNLLDFELPPAPTPRSVPSISIRELESMKSSYQSQISSLKATLTGREAEVESLKKAVGDAERRVGESLEASRLEKSKREHAEYERAEWEKRGQEVEKVLNNVREEVLCSEAEREELSNQAEENRRRADDAEARILDLETQLASARAALPTAEGGATGVDEGEVQRLVQARLDAKIEDVSRELHSVYKKKHETKVATLKKSYEARSEKKCAELQHKVDRLLKQNDELSAIREDTFSAVPSKDDTQTRKDLEEHMATIEQQRAQLAGLTEEMSAVKAQHARLAEELEKERVEKGELVAAVDEMLVLQSTDGAPAAIEDFRKSIQRPSGLRPQVPAFGAAPGESRIGRGKSTSSGLARPSVGKSKMMSNIERMGGGRTTE